MHICAILAIDCDNASLTALSCSRASPVNKSVCTCFFSSALNFTHAVLTRFFSANAAAILTPTESDFVKSRCLSSSSPPPPLHASWQKCAHEDWFLIVNVFTARSAASRTEQSVDKVLRKHAASSDGDIGGRPDEDTGFFFFFPPPNGG
jgi:hypothetical protein